MQHTSNNYEPQDQRMVDAQARIISKLNDNIRQLNEKVARLEKENHACEPKARMYDTIIAMVMANPSLQSIWDDLVVAMRLIDPSKFR
jgi:hypothetical protein